MLILTIVTALAGFTLGAYATYRYGPTLARRPESVAVGLIICGLVGAALGLVCLYVYLAIHSFVYAPHLDTGLLSPAGASLSSSPDAGIFVSAVFSIASESGVLLALAAVVFLLAPAYELPRG